MRSGQTCDSIPISSAVNKASKIFSLWSPFSHAAAVLKRGRKPRAALFSSGVWYSNAGNPAIFLSRGGQTPPFCDLFAELSRNRPSFPSAIPPSPGGFVDPTDPFPRTRSPRKVVQPIRPFLPGVRFASNTVLPPPFELEYHFAFRCGTPFSYFLDYRSSRRFDQRRLTHDAARSQTQRPSSGDPDPRRPPHSSALASEHPAIDLKKGWKCLFNGKDLTGWQCCDLRQRPGGPRRLGGGGRGPHPQEKGLPPQRRAVSQTSSSTWNSRSARPMPKVIGPTAGFSSATRPTPNSSARRKSTGTTASWKSNSSIPTTWNPPSRPAAPSTT